MGHLDHINFVLVVELDHVSVCHRCSPLKRYCSLWLQSRRNRFCRRCSSLIRLTVIFLWLQSKRDLFAKYEGTDNMNTSVRDGSSDSAASSRWVRGVGGCGEEEQRERVGRLKGRGGRPSLPQLYYHPPLTATASSMLPGQPLPEQPAAALQQQQQQQQQPRAIRQRHYSTVFTRPQHHPHPTPPSIFPLTPPSISPLTPPSISPLTPSSISPLTPPPLFLSPVLSRSR